jgi:hypothetical protein
MSNRVFGTTVEVYSIDGKFFNAGIVIEKVAGREVVMTAAPIIRYMTGWTLEDVKKYVTKRRWKIVLASSL